MNLEEKLTRSRSREKIDFSKIHCLHQEDPLVLVTGENIRVEPIWTVPGDFEGKMYADYIQEHPEYNGVYVRSELLKRLRAVAASFGDDYTLVVRAGHRPIAVQKRLLRECAEDYLADHPGASDQDALEHARMYVSDPDIKLPPHVCGAAVDVDIWDNAKRQFVDFGSPINLDDDISHLHSDKITEAQKQNRLLLLRAMLDADMSSYYAEWWHYSYGDEIWAWFYHQNACLYGLAEV